jgi:topoisomerase-4 subunit A
MIKGRASMGNILTKAEIHKISLKQKGSSTLGGRMVWFDHDILRLNYDGRGEELGEFQSDDLILVVLSNGDFYTTDFDLSNHYEDDILLIERFDSLKIWTAVLYDAEQKNPYLKRFPLEANSKKQNCLGENADSTLYMLTDETYPRIEVVFGGNDSFREPLILEAEQFVGVKSFKAKGKRITTYEIATVNELEPAHFEQTPNNEADQPTVIENDNDDPPISTPVLNLTQDHSGSPRQMNLFDDN